LKNGYTAKIPPMKFTITHVGGTADLNHKHYFSKNRVKLFHLYNSDFSKSNILDLERYYKNNTF